MKFILLTLLLYYIRLTSVMIAGDERPPPNCCLTVKKTRIPVGNIVDYTEQNKPLCPINAIKFHTKTDKTLCWDPDENWAKWAKQLIDAKKTTTSPLEGPMCRTRTSTRIPTTPIKTPGPGPETIKTPIKTPGPETKTSSRTVTSISTLPSTVTTLKTAGLQTEIRTTSTKPATESTESSQSPLSSTNPCTEPKHSTETSHKPQDTEAPQTTFTSTTRKKQLSKLIQRKRGKSKKQLRKYQMKIGS